MTENNLTKQLKSLYCKPMFDKEDFRSEDLFIINRFLSFNPKLVELSSKTERFMMGNVKKEFLTAYLHFNIPKQITLPYFEYIKTIEEQAESLEFLFEKIKRYYNWSDKELKNNIHLIMEIVNDREILRDWFIFFGIEKSKYGEFGIEFKKESKGLLGW